MKGLGPTALSTAAGNYAWDDCTPIRAGTYNAGCRVDARSGSKDSPGTLELLDASGRGNIGQRRKRSVEIAWKAASGGRNSKKRRRSG
jgi:hypothetical protein